MFLTNKYKINVTFSSIDKILRTKYYTCGKPRFLALMLTFEESAFNILPFSSQCSLSSAQA